MLAAKDALHLLLERSDLERCLERLPHSALRLKGRVALRDISGSITGFLLNFVNGRWTFSEIPGEAASLRPALALIGPALSPQDVEKAFAGIEGARVEQGELRFRLPEQPNV